MRYKIRLTLARFIGSIVRLTGSARSTGMILGNLGCHDTNTSFIGGSSLPARWDLYLTFVNIQPYPMMMMMILINARRITGEPCNPVTPEGYEDVLSSGIIYKTTSRKQFMHTRSQRAV